MNSAISQQESSAGTEKPLCETEERALLRLANMQFTPRMVTALLFHFGWSAAAIFDAADCEFDEVPGFVGRQLVRLRDPLLDVTDPQWSAYRRLQVTPLVANRSDFPQQLSEIPEAPSLLFMRGSLTQEDLSGVGMVGSRNASPYGISVAKTISRELAMAGVSVVSGGAIGIDAACHKGALMAGGRSVAFLGCGLAVDYPRENRRLFDAMVNSGALVSEYFIDAPPDGFRFPQRNRLISGLSLGTVVVEAPRSSGSLITARFALEQGRPVLAVPGNIDAPGSAGVNQLIKDGAIPVTETADILEALRLVAIPARKVDQIALALEDEEDLPVKTSTVEKKRIETIAAELPEAQRRLVRALSNVPRHIDTLASECDLNAATAGVEMTMLELAGLTRRLPGNCYILAPG